MAELDDKIRRLEQRIIQLSDKISQLQLSENTIKTEFKYMKILLSISLAANSYIGYRLGIPKL